MAQDLNTARRAEHTVARCTTYLLFACLLLEAGTLASTFSHRAELRLTADEPLLPGKAAPNDARSPAIAKLKLAALDRKSTRLNSSHLVISYAVFCLKKKKKTKINKYINKKKTKKKK